MLRGKAIVEFNVYGLTQEELKKKAMIVKEEINRSFDRNAKTVEVCLHEFAKPAVVISKGNLIADEQGVLHEC